MVQKYGGSSVSDRDSLERVALRVVERVAEGCAVVVVVSAMGTTTQELLAQAHTLLDPPPRRELDMLLSTGERISMSLLCMAIQARGVDAISFTGSQSGIMTTDRHFGARIVEVRPFRVQDALAQGKVVVVGGFQGMSYRREITTLGRGGSDTTAVALAAALDAEVCEIYSDVAGVYRADPRVVLDAEQLTELSYEQMQSMAEMGAKVLHDQAVRYAQKHQVALLARSTWGTPGQTWIRKDRLMQVDPQPTITALCPVVWVSFSADATEQWQRLRAESKWSWGSYCEGHAIFDPKQHLEWTTWSSHDPGIEVRTQLSVLSVQVAHPSDVRIAEWMACVGKRALWSWTFAGGVGFLVAQEQADAIQQQLYRAFCTGLPD